MVTLSLIDDFAQHFDFVHANTDDLKHQCYLIRYEVFGEGSKLDAASRAGLDIDQYDAHSLHILLRHRASGKYAATIRVIENQDRLKQRLLPVERLATEPLLVDKLPLHQQPRSSFSEISRMAIRAEFSTKPQFSKLTLGLFLAAISLARLEFHHYTFARLSDENFKSLRAQGLSFEHTHRLKPHSHEDGIYSLNVEAGISPSSPAYHLSQHILNEIAHQLHIPLVLESDEGAAQSA